MSIQVAEAIIAMINAGVYGCGYWTFADFPTAFESNYINKWGLYRWEVDNFTTKPSYYCVGLLSKFFRGPSEVFEITNSDSLIRTAAIRNKDNGSVSIVIINRNGAPAEIKTDIGKLSLDKPLRRYLYDPARPPFNYFGDLQEHSGLVSPKSNHFSDIIPPQSLVVYTTNYDDDPPAEVKGLKIEKKKVNDRERAVLSWEPNSEKDFCYYRIYRSEKPEVEIVPKREIGTTISNFFEDISINGMPPYYYKIIAVDQSGNAGR